MGRFTDRCAEPGPRPLRPDPDSPLILRAERTRTYNAWVTATRRFIVAKQLERLSEVESRTSEQEIAAVLGAQFLDDTESGPKDILEMMGLG